MATAYWLLLDRPQHPRREHEDRPDQRQNPAHRKPHDPERDEHQPHDRIQDQGHQRYRPAQHKQYAEQQKLDHRIQCLLAADPHGRPVVFS
jgi:hypothetical protein